MTPFLRFRKQVQARLARFRRDTSGSATVTYVVMLPVIFGAFLLTVDAGFSTMRASLLDRALDISARSIRNGTLATPTLSNIRSDMCSRLAVFPDCATTLKVQIISVPRASFTVPASTLACADSGSAIAPVLGFVTAQENPITVLRACIQISAYTPAALMSRRPGSYQINAETVIAGSAS